MDIGEKLLVNQSNSLYAPPEEIAESTGFMDSLKGLLKRKREPEEVTEDRSGSVHPVIVFAENEDDSESDASSDSEDTDSSDDSSSSSEEDVLEQLAQKNDEFGQKDGFIKFHGDTPPENNLKNESGSAESDFDDAIPEKQPVHLKKKFEWKEGLTFAQIRQKYEAIIDELCLIRQPQVWTHYRKNRDSASVESSPAYYVANDLAQLLHEEILDFVAYLSPTDEEHSVRVHVVESIRNIVKDVFGGDADVHVFGSFSTKLYLPSSDLDLVILAPETIPAGHAVPTSYYYKLANALKKANLTQGDSLQVITKARVPIIKFVDAHGHFQVDISFNVESGINASNIVQDLMAKYPALKPLTYVLKQFLLIRGLNEVYTGGLSSYGLSAILTSFLQMHPLIQSGEIKQEENLGVLLIEFLEFYGKWFNNDEVGINLNENGSYFPKRKLGAFSMNQSNDFKKDSLTVQDPENNDNDITGGTWKLYNVKKAFISGFNVLTGAMLEIYEKHRQEVIARDGNSPSNKRQKTSYDDSYTIHQEPTLFRAYSILATVIRVEDNVIKHREHIRGLFREIKNVN